MPNRVAFLALMAMATGLLQGAGLAPSVAGSSERHSGTVVKVDPQARTLIIEEMAAGGTTRTLQVRIAPQARLVLSRRLPDSQVADPRNPFKDTPIGLGDLRSGDFVVVELTGAGEKAEASSVTVTRREGAR
ncbi:MAG: hypothetical protein HY726_20245 [Candidatus Rokubacteria bacterium]|nr:hypothetical protein [Candidatus Rokubacteria bacterium]